MRQFSIISLTFIMLLSLSDIDVDVLIIGMKYQIIILHDYEL